MSVVMTETEYHILRLLGKVRSDVRKIKDALYRVEQKENVMAKELDQLTQDVADEVTVEESAITLIEGLKSALDAAGTDPAKLAALSTSLQTEKAKLAAAVVAGTPAAPAA